eukprot:gene38772-52365_t
MARSAGGFRRWERTAPMSLFAIREWFRMRRLSRVGALAVAFVICAGVSAHAALRAIAARPETVAEAPPVPTGYEALEHFPGAAALYADEPAPVEAAAPVAETAIAGATGSIALPDIPLPPGAGDYAGDASIHPAQPFSMKNASAVDKGRALQCLTAAVYYEAATEPDAGQQAVAQVLAQRPPLDTQLTGDEVKSAFRNSGLFLESSLAKGTLPQGTVPDMKAALIVLRQALTATLNTTSQTQGAPSTGTPPEQPVATSAGAFVAAVAPASAQQAQAAAAVLVPSLLPKTIAKNDPLQQAGPIAADDIVEPGVTAQTVPIASKGAEATARAMPNAAALSLLQEALQASPKGAGAAASLLLDDTMMLDLLPAMKAPASPLGADTTIARSNIPPPP